MARFDVYRGSGNGRAGYVLSVQSDLLHELDTRVVVPLERPPVAPQPARGLNPAFEVHGQTYVMLTQFIGTLPARDLRKPVASLVAHGDDITRALDVLLIGF